MLYFYLKIFRIIHSTLNRICNETFKNRPPSVVLTSNWSFEITYLYNFIAMFIQWASCNWPKARHLDPTTEF